MRYANGMVRSEILDRLQDKHCYEIVTWPMHYSDEQCMNMLRTNSDPNVVLYVALMGGITPIITVGGHKAFIADFTKHKKPNRFQPMSQNPSYSSIGKAEKHHQDQRS